MQSNLEPRLRSTGPFYSTWRCPCPSVAARRKLDLFTKVCWFVCGRFGGSNHVISRGTGGGRGGGDGVNRRGQQTRGNYTPPGMEPGDHLALVHRVAECQSPVISHPTSEGDSDWVTLTTFVSLNGQKSQVTLNSPQIIIVSAGPSTIWCCVSSSVCPTLLRDCDYSK